MISTLYSTAENPAGSLAQRIHFQQLESARGPIGAMAGIALVTAVLIAVGNALGVLISNTDSAAPAGVYRVVAHRIQRGELVAVCLPISIGSGGSRARVSAHWRVRRQRGAGGQDRGCSSRRHRRDRTRMGRGERRTIRAQQSCHA
jgi:hypothetical protein